MAFQGTVGEPKHSAVVQTDSSLHSAVDDTALLQFTHISAYTYTQKYTGSLYPLVQEFILLGVIAVSASSEALLMNLKRGHAGIDVWELCVCLCVCCEKEGNDVGSYYEISQAKHLCFTEQSDIILAKIIHCGWSDQCMICDTATTTWLLLRAFR